MSKVIELKATFENGDILTLSLLKNAKLPISTEVVDHYCLTYCEIIPESDNRSKIIYHDTEYFPLSWKSQAKQAFNKRMGCSNPKHESDLGISLDCLLSVKTIGKTS